MPSRMPKTLASAHPLLLIKLIEADRKRNELEKAVTNDGLGVVRDDCNWV